MAVKALTSLSRDGWELYRQQTRKGDMPFSILFLTKDNRVNHSILLRGLGTLPFTLPRSKGSRKAVIVYGYRDVTFMFSCPHAWHCPFSAKSAPTGSSSCLLVLLQECLSLFNKPWQINGPNKLTIMAPMEYQAIRSKTSWHCYLYTEKVNLSCGIRFDMCNWTVDGTSEHFEELECAIWEQY